MNESREGSIPEAPQATVANRRAGERHRFASGQICNVVTCPDCRGRQALLYDISTVGIAMILTEPLDLGRDMMIRILATETFRGRSLSGRVAHVAPLTGGNWRIGCAFTRPLSEAEVAELL